jgi:serine/threonine protein kinase
MKSLHYRIFGKVGQGQFGQVFCGCDRGTGDLVALKSLDHDRLKTRNFLRELAVLVRLKHLNIVSFQALEYTSTGRYIVMDYCQGGTLRQLMEAKPALSLIQKLRIVQDILFGLEHTHQHNIVHCDLKPENILLNVTSHGWVAKIADFGIAHFNEPMNQSDSTGYTGSPAYMAPERFYGRYSPQSDLYAVGVILYELVTGYRPFSGMPIEVMRAHFNHRLRIPKSTPLILKAVLSKALQKLPQHRYRSAMEMGLAVEASLKALEHDRKKIERPLNQMVVSRLMPDLPTQIHQTHSRSLQLQPKDLRLCFEGQDAVVRLWTRSTSCFMVSDTIDGLTLSQWTADGIRQQVGVLSFESSIHIDLDPTGRWLAISYPSINNSLKQNDSLKQWDRRIPNENTLHVFKLPGLKSVCCQPMSGALQHLWLTHSRHILVANSPDGGLLSATQNTQQLQLWNRRGQHYWSHSLLASIQQAALSVTEPDRLFAIIQGKPPTGLLIDLHPLRVKRVSLDMQADWLCAIRWGYCLVDNGGRFACLNRRGRMMAQGNLPIPSGFRITAISAQEPANLWIAMINGRQSIVCIIDLQLQLPHSLLTL